MPFPRGRLKTWWFVALVIVCNSFGNFFLARGMRNLPDVDSAASLLRAIFAPLVAIGILLLIVWLLARMMLLSWADLSYVLPVTSFGYVTNVLLGRFLLNEQVSLTRWAGTILIVCGTILVGLGAPHTHSGGRQ